MKFEDINNITLIGAGDMGHGIAEIALMAGYSVVLYDIKEEFVEKGRSRIDWSLKKLAEKARISESDHQRFMKNLTVSINIQEAVQQADLVIEAAPEKLELKIKIFTDLDNFSPDHAILASNTSNMSIDEIALATKRPDKVCGLHFFNPPVLMQLVEITKGAETSDETINHMVKFTKKLTKTPIVCQKDSPGFIANRINGPAALYTQILLDRNEYDPAKLDAKAMQMGMRMGPYELLDFTGADILYHSFNYFKERLSPDYAPPKKLEEMIQNNKLGKKTGEGIYKWPEKGRPEIDINNPADFDLMELVYIQINEAAKILSEQLATARDVDLGMKLGYNQPQGPLEVAESIDLKELTRFLDGIADKYGKEIFRAHPWIRDGTLLNQAKNSKQTDTTSLKDNFETIEILRDSEHFITTVLLNKPPLNTISLKLLQELNQVIDLLYYDDKTRVIVIRGSANCFSAGADITSFQDANTPWLAKKGVVLGQRVFKRLRDIPKPVIAAMERYAFGGGLELAMNCDIRYAKKSTQMGLTEVTLGLIPGWGGTQLMVRHLGVGKTMELALTGERIPAKRAFKMGLINKAVDDDDFEEEVYSLAKRISLKCGPIAVGIAKQMVNFGSQIPLDIGLELESYGSGLVKSTKDFDEGTSAFLNKRKVNFQNE
ncbi:MAG: 3-hydroxyacyl-CoA dehydrogenase NAD-binding domain-containing protein [Candidatus Hodarchaeales archaeon]